MDKGSYACTEASFYLGPEGKNNNNFQGDQRETMLHA